MYLFKQFRPPLHARLLVHKQHQGKRRRVYVNPVLFELEEKGGRVWLEKARAGGRLRRDTNAELKSPSQEV